jgi:hypothetical protein
MKKEVFDDYINRFNKRDATTFDDYIHPDASILLYGHLLIKGRQGMKDHYARIWSGYTEQLEIERFVSDDHTVAIEMRAHFTATKEDEKSVFGPILAGETFDSHNVIIYRIEDGLFTDIKIGNLSRVKTNLKGEKFDVGQVHK